MSKITLVYVYNTFKCKISFKRIYQIPKICKSILYRATAGKWHAVGIQKRRIVDPFHSRYRYLNAKAWTQRFKIKQTKHNSVYATEHALNTAFR